MANPLEQALLELQTQLEATQEQMKTMAESHDELQKAHAKLQEINQETERARATLVTLAPHTCTIGRWAR